MRRLLLCTSLSIAAAIAVLAPQAKEARADEKAAACGGRGQPPSPLQKIMRGMNKRDAASVRQGLAQISTPPDGYANWSKHVDAALSAAKDSDFDPAAVEAACKACHTEYRQRFAHEATRCDYKK